MASSSNSQLTVDDAIRQYIDQRLQEQGQSIVGQFAALGDQIQQLSAALGATMLTPHNGGRPATSQPPPVPTPTATRYDHRAHFLGQQPPSFNHDGILPRPAHLRPPFRAPAPKFGRFCYQHGHDPPIRNQQPPLPFARDVLFYEDEQRLFGTEEIEDDMEDGLQLYHPPMDGYQ